MKTYARIHQTEISNIVCAVQAVHCTNSVTSYLDVNLLEGLGLGSPRSTCTLKLHGAQLNGAQQVSALVDLGLRRGLYLLQGGAAGLQRTQDTVACEQ